MENFRRSGSGKAFGAETVDDVTIPQVAVVTVEEGKASAVSPQRPLPVKLAQEGGVLTAILLELRRMNDHFEIINGTDIKDKDIRQR